MHFEVEQVYMLIESDSEHSSIKANLLKILTKHQTAFSKNPNPSYQLRIAQLKQLKQTLLANTQAIAEAINQDYGYRSVDESYIADIMPCVNNINYTIKHLKSWMKPSRRHAGKLLSPAKVYVQYQPLGVIGIIAPWNFPIVLSIGPLITAIAAGNQAMLKLSEFTPNTNRVITEILNSAFDKDGNEKMATVIEGQADVAALFSSLPFDHLLFTGSTSIGRQVMRAAAENLTPVTLELGGKSPVIIAPDISIETAVERMIYGKCLNSGQICVAPDYILLPESKTAEFIHGYKAKFAAMYGNVSNNSDYSAIINQRQFERLMAIRDDAINKGAKVQSANNEPIDFTKRKIPTQLITGVTDDMRVMQEEIFGPLLPIIGYQDTEQAVDYINQRPRPLALYIMSFNHKVQQQILTHTHSGGACINETVLHVAADDAPFGGIGSSGIGHYHGKEGFLTFSHAKTVLSRGKFNSGKFAQPPYGSKLQSMFYKLFMR